MTERLIVRKTQEFDLSKLETWAIEENWEEINAVINSIANIQGCVLWAVGSLKHENSNLRRLAAIILETTPFELVSSSLIALNECVFMDENSSVRFWAACALFNHGIYSEGVINIVKLGLTNEETRDAAEKYLALLEENSRSMVSSGHSSQS